VIDKVNSGEGTLGQLTQNDSLYRNLENASKNMDLLLEDMRLRPKRYVHFSVFGKKEKN
jgi:phospholipid/cholesterol/gamma-HCH transport system substrate-binding protein